MAYAKSLEIFMRQEQRNFDMWFSKKSSNQINIFITLQKNSKNIITFTLCDKEHGFSKLQFFMDFNHMIENSLGFFILNDKYKDQIILS